ncbi:MAG: HKD family nuclease [Phycisphaerales bacterium]|jgi:HKD family nuclease
MYESIFTNNKLYGGKLLPAIEVAFNDSSQIDIATGYIGRPLIEHFEQKFLEADRCRILVGMYFQRGIPSNTLIALERINKQLASKKNGSGVFVSSFEYHGKLYQFQSSKFTHVFLGSSNFSHAGFATRHECTLKVEEKKVQQGLSYYLDYLFSHKETRNLTTCKMGKGARKKDKKDAIASIKDNLSKCKISASDFPDLSKKEGVCSILLRPDKQPKSSLNLFNGSGRLDRKSGKYQPRPWYEVELQSRKVEIRSPFYPNNISSSKSTSMKGHFTAYMIYKSNKYRFLMKVHSAGGKNIASADESGGRELLGYILKNKLIDKGALEYGDLVTAESLSEYGRESIDLIKLNADTYFVDFDV